MSAAWRPRGSRLAHHGLATKCNASNANTRMNSNPDVVAKRNQYGADITGHILDGSASYCGVSNGSCCMTTITEKFPWYGKAAWRTESLSRGINILVINGKSGRKAIKLMGD